MKITNFFKILLLGDSCTDVYQYGVVDRVSPEAPVPIFKYEYQETKQGMGSNVCKNLQALNCNVTFISGSQTSTKTRLIDIRTNQQVLRIDKDIISEPINLNDLTDLSYDAIVISDYGKGSITYDIINKLRNEFSGPIFLDTKKHDLSKFNDIFVKVNELEYNKLKSYNNLLIVTLGNKGAMYKTTTESFFQTSRVEVSDMCGAGDTFLAALAYQYLITNNIENAIGFANKAASITVQHIGNYAPTLSEIN